jgi:hypothetical protein
MVIFSFDRINPFDWSLLPILKKYNDEDEKECSNYPSNKLQWNQKNVHNNSAIYYHFQNEYLLLSFFKKYLVFAVIIYLVLFLQTAHFLQGKLFVESNTNTYNFFLMVWGSLLIFHFFFYFSGVYLGYKYYDRLQSTSLTIPNILVPISNRLLGKRITDKKIELIELGMVGFYGNMIAFIFYQLTITDILFLLIWNIFFFWNQEELSFTAMRTDSRCFNIMLFGYSLVLFIGCILEIYCALPVTFTVLLFLILLILFKVQFKNNNLRDNIELPLRRFKRNLLPALILFLFFFLFILSLLYFFLFSMDVFSSTIVLSRAIQALLSAFLFHSGFAVELEFPSFDLLVKTVYGTNFLESYLGKYIFILLPKMRERFYQLFFLFYIYKLVYYMT